MTEAEGTKPNYYLGFDFSTQQVKAIVINEDLEVACEAAVHFDNDLPEFRTYGGVIRKPDDITITAPTIMWVKAIDLLMDKLKVTGINFEYITAISGAGQQHGSVYWRKGAEKVISNLDPSKFLYDQLSSCFALPDSPVWMDSSTGLECKVLEEKLGGAQNLADITGSCAYERFTGNQIAKIFRQRQDAYQNSERISLVSSFACSIFLGKYAPIDFSDGSGMNLLDIHSKTWNNDCLEACAPGFAADLAEKLGNVAASTTVLGPINRFFVERFGFGAECQVVAFTGDNPASLAGMRLKEGDIAVSLGTSDTLFVWLNQPKPALEGHIFCNPINPDAYMALLCFKNGSMMREAVRNEYADNSWDQFASLLQSTPRGNFGYMGLHFDVPEITPALNGRFRFNQVGDEVSKFASPEIEIRALIEGQFLAKRLHAEKLGFHIDATTRILVTGGASQNAAILQVLSDVFNAPVYIQDVANSACLGGAYIAKFAVKLQERHSEGKPAFDFSEITAQGPEFKLVCNPHKDASQIYDAMTERYGQLEHVAEQLQKMRYMTAA